MIWIEEVGSNVYADLGVAYANEMLVKARLAAKIGELIDDRKWTQQQAADALGLTQPKLSKMLRGQLRGMSEAIMTECLVLLGRVVHTVVEPVHRSAWPGNVEITFAS
ncbi:helix-turn-helix domain-containing protein [Luteibacter rhizovicinus]|nr:helix-turn-helix transcriptional regulator [Luteibacter rhizovicinus]